MYREAWPRRAHLAHSTHASGPPSPSRDPLPPFPHGRGPQLWLEFRRETKGRFENLQVGLTNRLMREVGTRLPALAQRGNAVLLGDGAPCASGLVGVLELTSRVLRGLRKRGGRGVGAELQELREVAARAADDVRALAQASVEAADEFGGPGADAAGRLFEEDGLVGAVTDIPGFMDLALALHRASLEGAAALAPPAPRGAALPSEAPGPPGAGGGAAWAVRDLLLLSATALEGAVWTLSAVRDALSPPDGDGDGDGDAPPLTGCFRGVLVLAQALEAAPGEYHELCRLSKLKELLEGLSESHATPAGDRRVRLGVVATYGVFLQQPLEDIASCLEAADLWAVLSRLGEEPLAPPEWYGKRSQGDGAHLVCRRVHQRTLSAISLAAAFRLPLLWDKPRDNFDAPGHADPVRVAGAVGGQGCAEYMLALCAYEKDFVVRLSSWAGVLRRVPRRPPAPRVVRAPPPPRPRTPPPA